VEQTTSTVCNKLPLPCTTLHCEDLQSTLAYLHPSIG
jgi:hypothetical protein